MHANEYRWMATHNDADTPCEKVLTQPDWGVGRTYMDGEATVGKVSHATKSFYAPYFGKEHKIDYYDVLIRNCWSSASSFIRTEKNGANMSSEVKLTFF